MLAALPWQVSSLGTQHGVRTLLWLHHEASGRAAKCLCQGLCEDEGWCEGELKHKAKVVSFEARLPSREKVMCWEPVCPAIDVFNSLRGEEWPRLSAQRWVKVPK